MSFVIDAIGTRSRASCAASTSPVVGVLDEVGLRVDGRRRGAGNGRRERPGGDQRDEGGNEGASTHRRHYFTRIALADLERNGIDVGIENEQPLDGGVVARRRPRRACHRPGSRRTRLAQVWSVAAAGSRAASSSLRSTSSAARPCAPSATLPRRPRPPSGRAGPRPSRRAGSRRRREPRQRAPPARGRRFTNRTPTRARRAAVPPRRRRRSASRRRHRHGRRR